MQLSLTAWKDSSAASIAEQLRVAVCQMGKRKS
ncbi:hypothetical protein T11_17922 [Trichinella zimbabwensis]|uniref:Uncharacterized protein n=1 Tax=Trichinella zimbabwensis TaxID=268475 RepID=A0A0V1F5Y8_9BILA|nr:hypothetical protein T11_17922 [Trichinella zimbabwensis]